MRRWNGWGDDSTESHLGKDTLEYLQQRLGSGIVPQDAKLTSVLASIPPSSLPPNPLIKTDELTRLRYSRGQSMSDWIELRGGTGITFTDGVAFPENEAEISDLYEYARHTGASLIPYGGGTSVAGHINPLLGGEPVLTVAMERMSRLLCLDHDSRLATFGAGIAGPDLEAELRAHGYTLGHYPQSFEYSTLGGWIATRSSGQQSLGYGRIERLFAGGNVETPAGSLELPSFPASAAGPDLREIVLGSEGRIGIITKATVRVVPVPPVETFLAVFFKEWERGFEAVRKIVQAGLPLTMLRYSTPVETETTLALAGRRNIIAPIERYLDLRGAGAQKCMLIMGFKGSRALVQIGKREALALAHRNGGVYLGTLFGKQWHKNRFKTPYLRNSLWEAGYAVDTVETATVWEKIPQMVDSIECALKEAAMVEGEKLHVFTHLSHLYPYGSSVYTTYVFRVANTPEKTLERWQRMKKAASLAIVNGGGTISHQHGVGADHLPYLEAEKGKLGLEGIRAIIRQFDPEGLLNPGKLVL
ncbi:MAG: FAD-binding oxidoreductase [Chloroflexi bacterium]|uniref:FAD-binding oxidoreductase n=1 Tax=Candidatus Chlorohelix allophototropha TaxID=3003348 RepID=A0A8T7LWJ2_9CHLR|nr:FAD-binding oxidoreductase [Chloroflexota bacterium]WJW65739.1 FAD-binding oxidoreductase [Chloroflexota bacterium L227-S17]